jgi:hypothetical protein
MWHLLLLAAARLLLMILSSRAIQVLQLVVVA